MAAKLDALISEQAASRPDDLPLSTGPLEQFFRTLDATLGNRAAKMTNKRRADALLKPAGRQAERLGSTTTGGPPSSASTSTPGEAEPTSSASTPTPGPRPPCAERAHARPAAARLAERLKRPDRCPTQAESELLGRVIR